MGQQTVTKNDVIDETFAGLSMPAEMHSVGRPDLTEDRPGDILVAEVKKFEAEGGFKKIADDRNKKREIAENADLSVAKESFTDFGLNVQSKDSSDLTISDGEK